MKGYWAVCLLGWGIVYCVNGTNGEGVKAILDVIIGSFCLVIAGIKASSIIEDLKRGSK